MATQGLSSRSFGNKLNARISDVGMQAYEASLAHFDNVCRVLHLVKTNKWSTAVAFDEACRQKWEEYAALELLEDEGSAVVWYPLFNYAKRDYDITKTMIQHPHTVVGVADGGAHVNILSDASNCTYLLTHWARDRSQGPKLPIDGPLVKKQV